MDDFCDDCIHLQTHEESATCDKGFWGRRSLKEYHPNLWGYVNFEQKLIVPYYPVGEYEDNWDWDIRAIRPSGCKVKGVKEVE